MHFAKKRCKARYYSGIQNSGVAHTSETPWINDKEDLVQVGF
jgi:hypothetical protein